MNNNYLPYIEEYLFSGNTYKNNLDSETKTNAYNYSNEINFSLNNTNNLVCPNVTFNLNQNKKNSASFSLNLINNKNKLNHNQNNNFTQKIILHSLNKMKYPKSSNQKENENCNNGIQHIILKTLKKNKNENAKQFNNNDNNEKYNNIIFNKNNIIRVILSSQKMIQNFPMEYINEMVGDLCNNLYNIDYNLEEKIKLNCSSLLFGQQIQENFYEKRMSLFNFILKLNMNSSISESTLFLTFNIFDIYVCNHFTSSDNLLLVIITSLVLAIKYIETTIPNLDELCAICDKQFSKEDINKCELKIMEKLNYNISMPTIYDLYQFIKVIKNMKEKEYNLGLFILEMFVISGGVLKYNPLSVIEAIYLLVLQTNGKEMKNLNLYKFMVNKNINIKEYNENINKCLFDIKDECLQVKNKNFKYLIKKFSNEKYQKISIDFQLL